MNLRDLMQDFTEKRTAYETLRDSKADVAEQRTAMEAMRSAKEAYDLEKENQSMVLDNLSEDRGATTTQQKIVDCLLTKLKKPIQMCS